MIKIKYYCSHQYDDGRDAVQIKNEACYCPICNQSWNMETMEKEEVEKIINKLLNQLQLMIWSNSNADGDISRSSYIKAIEVLNNFPDLWESSMWPITEPTPYSRWIMEIEKTKITLQDIEMHAKILKAMILQFEKQCDNEAKK